MHKELEMEKRIALQEQITKLLSERVHVESPSVDTDLMESGLLDSLTLVELIVGLEEEFGIKIPFEEVELDHFRSVESIARFVIDQGVIYESIPA
jgi:acyl carrier protein